jgi:drug/metabolite transporter (DMT)-like permease
MSTSSEAQPAGASALPSTAALVLFVGVFACSTSVLFIKSSAMPAASLAAGRLWVATLVLAPVFLRERRAHAERLRPGDLARGALPGVVLGLHLLSWNVGARMTSAVNATLLVNMVPLATPFLLWLTVRERLNRREWIGTALALAGIGVLTASDLEIAQGHLIGDAVCFGSMLLFALYLVFARRHRDLPSVFLYIVPLYAAAATTCSVAAALFDLPFALERPAWEWGMVLGLGLVPTVLGHSALNFAMTRLRGQAVPVANLAQPLFAGTMAFVLLGEVPATAFYAACALILAGATLALVDLRAHEGTAAREPG